jgi:hypothetical protein
MRHDPRPQPRARLHDSQEAYWQAHGLCSTAPFRAFQPPDSINTRLTGSNRPVPTPDGAPPEVQEATQLAIMIWNTQLTPLSQLNLSVDDPALVIAKALGWLVMAADDAAVMQAPPGSSPADCDRHSE